jgi:ribosomal-protein-alanine N-acetyltransferase
LHEPPCDYNYKSKPRFHEYRLHTGQIMLTGKNIIISEFEPLNITDEYIGWLNDPDVVKFSNQRFLMHNRKACEEYLASFSGTNNRFLIIRHNESNNMIGTMTIYRNLHHGTADVGIMIGDKNFWGKGVGQEAWDAVLIWLLTEVGVRKVTAGALQCNYGMIRLMERSRMELEAVKKKQEIVDGAAIDLVYYAKFADA